MLNVNGNTSDGSVVYNVKTTHPATEATVNEKKSAWMMNNSSFVSAKNAIKYTVRSDFRSCIPSNCIGNAEEPFLYHLYDVFILRESILRSIRRRNH